MWPLVGSLVSAGANLFGGLLSSKSNADANAANLQQNMISNQIRQDEFATNLNFQREQFAASQAMAAQNLANSKAMADQNIDLQREFAQNGIRWKVADAVAAGLSPLMGAGAGAVSYSPVSVGSASLGSFGGGSSGGSSSIPMRGDDSMGRSVAAMGQDVGRAINATRTQDERVHAAATALTLERGQLENDLIRSQIAKNTAASNPPMAGSPYLLPGQTESGATKDQPLKRVSSGYNEGSEPGAITDVGYARTATGWAPVPSNDVKERIEDNLIQEVLHAVRNNALPTVGINQQVPFKAPEGKYWYFNPVKQEYQLWDRGRSPVGHMIQRGYNYLKGD